MQAFIAAGFFALGAIVASFAGVIAGRLYTGEGIATGRSRCDACGQILGVHDLIPILSWLIARGRARCCGARISPASPCTEVVLGVLFALAYLRLGLSLQLAFFLVALVLLAALVLYDLAHQILPPALLVLFILTVSVFAFVSAPSRLDLVAGGLLALIFAAFFAALYIFSGGRAMGLADSPLVFGLALLAGPYALAGFLFSFWIGAAVGIAILARTPAGSRMGIEVPFAPFLAAGFLLAYFIQWNPLPFVEIIRAAALRS